MEAKKSIKQGIQALAVKIVKKSKEGIRYSDLVNELHSATGALIPTIRGYVWNLDAVMPDEVSKPSTGLFVAVADGQGHQKNAVKRPPKKVSPTKKVVKRPSKKNTPKKGPCDNKKFVAEIREKLKKTSEELYAELGETVQDEPKKKRGRPKKAENVEKDAKLLAISFFNPFDPKNRTVPAQKVSTIYSDEEVVILDLFKNNIHAMARKYAKMAQHAVGGESKDLVSTLQMKTIELFRKWREKVLSDKSIGEKTGLDAIKYISWHIHRQVIDLARYQRDKVEPGRWQIIDDANVDEDANVSRPSATDAMAYEHDLLDWTASLSPLQKKLLEVWKAEKLCEQRIMFGNDKSRRNVINALVRKAKKHIPNVTEGEIRKALSAFPKM